MVTCLSEGGEWNYLIGIDFIVELRWVWVAQGRCFQGELVFGKAWVRLRYGFWALGSRWNGIELENGNYVFEGEIQFCNRGFMDSKAWLMKGIPSPIYREGVGMVFMEKVGGSFKKMVSSKNDKTWETWWTSVTEFWPVIPLHPVCFATCIIFVGQKWSQNMLRCLWFCPFWEKSSF